MATIKEIAERAGVSRGTVDRVINNRGAVCSETEEKIRAIIKELDYKPNKAGMALAAQKKKYLIGIILFSKQNPFFDEVMEGFQEKADELSVYGCEITVKRVAYHPDAQLSAIRACVKEGIKGLIITPYNDERICSELNHLSKAGIPVITVNSDAENTNRLAYVGSDFYKSGKAAGALMKLVTSDNVYLGIVNGDSNILCHSQRFSGFVDTLSEDRRFKVVDQGENFDDEQKSFELVTQMLKNHPEINALYFTAGGVYGGCRAVIDKLTGNISQKLQLCHSIKIITFDDVPTTIEMMDRGIITATICQQPYWQGSKSLDLMFSYLSNPQTKVEENYYSELTIKIREII